MKKIIFFLCFFHSLSAAKAQTINDFERNRVSLVGALTSDNTWQMDIAYHYMFSAYAGLGASIGIWKEYAVGGVPKGNGWRIADDYKKTANFYLRPSAYLVSPTLVKVSDGNLKWFAEPGLMMNIPYAKVVVYPVNELGIENEWDVRNVSTNKGKWAAFDCKTGISIDFDNTCISVGYQYSTLDVYGMRRELVYDNKRFNEFYPKRKAQHGGFISISRYF